MLTERDLQRRLALETTILVSPYVLPDGRTIRVGAERFEAPECLFDPSRIDIEKPGIADQLFNTIQGADIDTRPEFYQVRNDVCSLKGCRLMNVFYSAHRPVWWIFYVPRAPVSSREGNEGRSTKQTL